MDVVKQETKCKGELNIDFDYCIEKGSMIFKDPSWYGNLLFLGEQSQNPIFTFTTKTDYSDQINKPDNAYLKTIIEGIKETFPAYNEFDICDYLLPLEGIKENYIKEELINLINENYSYY